MFGFATLSLALGALQLLLDRGQQNDWFSSAECWIEAIIAGRRPPPISSRIPLLTPAQKSFLDTACSRIRISSPACYSSSSWAWSCMPRAP